MAKKKQKSDGKKLQRRTQPQETMRQLATGPDTPLDQAQNLIYEAFDNPNPRRRVELAREALQLSPDCADAYVLLAEHAPTRKQSLEHYKLGVAAGERAIGPDAFREYAGHFWGVLETRPYMRARFGLAHALWIAARRDEAVQHLQDMLRLNPNDNQGVRYTLAGFLLFLDRDNDLVQLLEQYPEGSATISYTRALLAFRKDGDTPNTRKLLQRAIKTNRHIPDYLLGTKFPPSIEPEYYSAGDENEALGYISGFLVGWKSTDGAIPGFARLSPSQDPRPKPRGQVQP